VVISYVERQSGALLSCVSVLLREVRLVDRRKLFSVHRQCFVGHDAVIVLVKAQRCTQSEATTLLNHLLQRGFIQHADSQPISATANGSPQRSTPVPPFENSSSAYYQFTAQALQTPPPSSSSSSVDAFDSFCGWLDKRAESGLHSYQRRYFVVSLQDQSLCYYRTPDALFPLQFIPLTDILFAQQLMEQKKGCRFDVLLTHRVYHLLAESAKQATEWVAAINRATKDNRERQADRGQTKQRQPEPRTPTAMKPFWQQGGGYTANTGNSGAAGGGAGGGGGGAGLLPSSSSHLALSTLHSILSWSPPSSSSSSSPLSSSPSSLSRVSALKLAFFRLNFSVSALNQPDFFHDLLEDFQSDDDILAFLLDVVLNPDTSQPHHTTPLHTITHRHTLSAD